MTVLLTYEWNPLLIDKSFTNKRLLLEHASSSSSSDDFSEDERDFNPDVDGAYVFDDHLDNFRREIQDLVCYYSWPLPLCNFESLYGQRYKKTLDYQSFGVDGLEELVEKVKDVELQVDEVNKMKFLKAKLIRGRGTSSACRSATQIDGLHK